MRTSPQSPVPTLLARAPPPRPAMASGRGRLYHAGMNLDSTGLMLVALFVLMPAAVLVWVSPRWRVACFLLGLALAFVTPLLADGPHDSIMILIFVGFGIAIAALLVEIPVFTIRTIRRQRAASRGDPGGAAPEVRPGRR
jgi:hypothetical protein